ncbi:V-type ATP synthase subunit I [Methanohalophilus sp.]|uniref:V-type ATP synthase subunit I n=1 Tax=Methanohalophilus sp. TaxID=1966352 RepID=UPI00262416FB|nr:V-type ATP synthase subunit I [Methanohalophilus sp.]MDK2892716.1 V/A-type H+/Na+-transporting ATPase subunit [Methanohalophilus sp.]
MLKPQSMSRAVIVGHKNVLNKTVDTLHNTNILHIEDFNESESTFKIGKPFENAADVSKKLVKLRAISSYLGIKPKEVPKQNAERLWMELDEKLSALESELNEKTDEKGALENRLKDLEALQKDLEPLTGIPISLENYSGYESIAVFVGIVKEDVRSAISEITNEFELDYDSQKNVIALFVKKEMEQSISKVLLEFEYRELKIPKLEGKPAELISNAEQEKTKILSQIEAIDRDITSIREKYSDFILATDEILSIESQKSEAPLRFATSEQSFVIDGWVPSKDFEKLKTTVEKATNGHVFVTEQEVKIKEEEKSIPIEYDNPKISRPFQAIMDLYARPRYTELDPTVLVFIAFPLFYGMILGDIGYALILLSLALGIKKFVKIEGLVPLMNVLIYCQISSLIFGLLYGEVLGFSLASLHTEHGVVEGLIPGFETITLFESPIAGEVITYPIHRTHMATTMILISIIIGIIHINMGYILGFINEYKKHGLPAAVLEKASWFIVEIGAGLIALGALGYMPVTIGAAVLLIGVVMLAKGEGIKGPLELPTLLSNTLSYSRIAAVGLSSVYIASTVNLIAFEMLMPEKFGIMTFVAIIVFLIGHAINTILSIIAPGLHSLRLQYVEFFTKFYEGGGKKYNPFGYKRKYTEE